MLELVRGKCKVGACVIVKSEEDLSPFLILDSLILQQSLMQGVLQNRARLLHGRMVARISHSARWMRKVWKRT